MSNQSVLEYASRKIAGVPRLPPVLGATGRAYWDPAAAVAETAYATRTENTVYVAGAAGSLVVSASVSGDVTQRYTMDAKGTMLWSSGAAASSISMGRSLVHGGILVSQSQNAETTVTISNGTSGTASESIFEAKVGVLSTLFGQTSSGFTPAFGKLASEGYILAFASNSLALITGSAFPIRFSTTGTERSRITPTGEFLLGTTVSGAGSPLATLKRDQNADTFIRIDNASGGAAATVGISVTTGALLDIQGSFTAYAVAAEIIFGTSTAATGGFTLRTGTVAPIIFAPNGLTTTGGRFTGTAEFIVGAAAVANTEFISFQRNQNALSHATVSNTTSGTLAHAALNCRVGPGLNMQIGRTSALFTPASGIQAAEGYLSNDSGNLAIVNSAAGSIRFSTTAIERGSIAASGAVTFLHWMNVGTVTDAVANGDVAFGLTGTSRFFYDQSAATGSYYSGANLRVNITPSNTAFLSGLIEIHAMADEVGFLIDGSNYPSLVASSSGTSGGQWILAANANADYWSNYLQGSQLRVFNDTLGDVAYWFMATGNFSLNDVTERTVRFNSFDGTNPQLRLSNSATVFSTMRIETTTGLMTFTAGAAGTRPGIVFGGNYRFAYGTSALAVGATEGDFFIQSCAGTPTGVPASIPTGQKAVRYDSTAKKLWIYDGAWLRGQVAAVDVIWA
jgi:hypothetical protein